MSLSKAVFYLCIVFVAGVLLGAFLNASQIFGLVFLIVGVFLVAVFWEYKRVVFAGAAIVILTLGVMRYDAKEQAAFSSDESGFGASQKTMFRAVVAEGPAIRPDSVQLVLEAEAIPAQRILVSVDRFADYQYGDVLEVSGKLEVPPVFEEFNYKEYLARQGISFVLRDPDVKLVERGAHEGVWQRAYAAVLEAKHRLRAVLQEHIRPPESTILGAIVLGDKSALDAETKEKLNASGLRHVTAISGMHVGLLTILLMRFLVWAGLWRQQAFFITIALMLLFIVMTGLQASAIRAGIMGGMVLLGQHLGRPNVSARALVFAAALMLAANPLLLGDVGFQLSFLAVLGIVSFLPMLQHFSRALPQRLRALRDIIGMTISAQVLTLPVLVFNFGQVSAVSLLTNALVVPLLPFLLAFGFVFLIGGAVWAPVGFLLSLPVFFLLRYLAFVIDFSSQLPFAAVQAENVPVFWLAVLYIPIGLFYWKFRKRERFLV